MRCAVLALLALRPALCGAWEVSVPTIRGLQVEQGETILIPGATNTICCQLADGRIVVAGDDRGIWSEDGGREWAPGPVGPPGKTTIDLGDGEVLGFGQSTTRRPDGLYQLGLVRSTDNWETTAPETAVFDLPLATSCGSDDGDACGGLIMHHGIIRLSDGRLMATMYGNYQGDSEMADGYPVALNLRKRRTVVVFSSDRGRSWGDPVTVAYGVMLGRGPDPDTRVLSYELVPAITQEGFCEADLVRAPNGDILCAMRSGGRIGVGKVPIFPTPMYLSRSADEGKTWTPPVPMADRGVCPSLIALDSGVIVCAYARPGGGVLSR